MEDLVTIWGLYLIQTHILKRQVMSLEEVLNVFTNAPFLQDKIKNSDSTLFMNSHKKWSLFVCLFVWLSWN